MQEASIGPVVFIREAAELGSLHWNTTNAGDIAELIIHAGDLGFISLAVWRRAGACEIQVAFVATEPGLLKVSRTGDTAELVMPVLRAAATLSTAV